MYQYKYPRPSVTADAVIFGKLDEALAVCLIRRGNPNEPFYEKWALPGGFIEPHEDAKTCAMRELYEETGIVIPYDDLHEVGSFSRIDRDPRDRVISIAFMGCTSSLWTKAGDDASIVDWYKCNALPELAFDHAEIIEKALCHEDFGMFILI